MKMVSLVNLLVAGATIATTQITLAQGRIVGGAPAQIKDYPFMTALSDKNGGQFCGGSLVAKRWVLTAAHCVTNRSATRISVVMGRTNLNARNGEEIDVKRIISHPKYIPDSGEVPDIALLELARDARAEPIELVHVRTSLDDPDTMATTIGWGRTSENGNSSKKLRQVSVPIMSNAACNRAYINANRNFSAALEICAGYPTGGRDACQGDSGGPLIVDRGQGLSSLQVGVVSWGSGCARPDAPGVYARISRFVDWMTRVTDGAVTGVTDDETQPTPATSPTAAFSFSCEGLRCAFDASASTQGSSPIERYHWNFGDNTEDLGRRVVRTFTGSGTYAVTLSVIAESGAQDAMLKNVTLTEPEPEPESESESGTGTGTEPPLTTDSWTRTLVNGARRAIPGPDGFRIGKGPLVSILRHSKNVDFDILIQKRAGNSGRWRTLRRAETKKPGEEFVHMKNVGAGYYRYLVYSSDDAGRFRVIARHR